MYIENKNQFLKMIRWFDWNLKFFKERKREKGKSVKNNSDEINCKKRFILLVHSRTHLPVLLLQKDWVPLLNNNQ